VAGEAAVLVDPADGEALRQGLEQLLGGASRRAQLRELGLHQARAAQWTATAQRTAALLGGLL
jgi:hypothetical protein